jgi:hypothetical protein
MKDGMNDTQDTRQHSGVSLVHPAKYIFKLNQWIDALYTPMIPEQNMYASKIQDVTIPPLMPTYSSYIL